MNKNTKEESQALIDKALNGDKNALEALIENTQDVVFNLSLRMLGTFVMTCLKTFHFASHTKFPNIRNTSYRNF